MFYSATTSTCVDGHDGCPEYHALGQCSNEFIQFLCPLSCRACGEERDFVVPITCEDKLGQICSMFASQCSNPVFEYGCEKTCGVCASKPVKCEDTLVQECQALGREGMCAMASFRRRCPVTCDACSNDVTTGNLLVSKLCSGGVQVLFAHANEQSSV